MKRGLLVLLMVLAVGALANAEVAEPEVGTEELNVGAQDGVLLPADFDLEAWMAPDVETGSCEASSTDSPFDAARKPIGGANCGGTICGAFQYCCNPSCGTCVYYGMSCTQQSCN